MASLDYIAIIIFYLAGLPLLIPELNLGDRSYFYIQQTYATILFFTIGIAQLIMSVLVLKKLGKDDQLREAMESEISVIKKVLGTFSISYACAVIVGLLIVLDNTKENFNKLRVKFCVDERGLLGLGTFFYLLL
jgi:hypothetical protein